MRVAKASVSVAYDNTFEESPLKVKQPVTIQEGPEGDVVPSTVRPDLRHITMDKLPEPLSKSCIKYEPKDPSSEGLGDVTEGLESV